MAPTAVFMPGESHGQRSLAGYSPWSCKESDTTERLTHKHTYKGKTKAQGGDGELRSPSWVMSGLGTPTPVSLSILHCSQKGP